MDAETHRLANCVGWCSSLLLAVAVSRMLRLTNTHAEFTTREAYHSILQSESFTRLWHVTIHTAPRG